MVFWLRCLGVLTIIGGLIGAICMAAAADDEITAATYSGAFLAGGICWCTMLYAAAAALEDIHDIAAWARSQAPPRK